ncbi:uncharacterized protein LOC110019247 [Phalaenopsis equestris]|uniref:uncharacterized protein LOC110019247 n=1 Tax=Phalaenopsis equestris TaxID=78828 RepID=UPI0009E65716|nr:uncharacterized protein LOC110019247 [Phalaenopsis equestris]
MEMQGLRLGRTAPSGEDRSACASSLTPRMENYAEIFDGFAASCSIPVLALPEAMDGCDEELAGSQNSGLNYFEIFGVLDAGGLSLSYEELFSMERKGSSERDEDDRLRDKGVAQVEIGSPGLPAEMRVEHVTAPKIDQISAKFCSKFDAGKNSKQSVPNEAKATICVSRNQANCGPELEALTESHPGIVEDDGSGNVASDDHILSGYVTEEKEAEKQSEILNRCFVSAIIDSSESDLNGTQKPHYIDEAYDLKQCSPSSSYHSASSGDAPLTDYSFLTISDINLRTQPLEVSPPLRAAPKLDMKQGVSKSRPPDASDIAFNQNYQAHHVGGPGTCHLLKETMNSTLPSYSNVEMDGSKAAAASAAAVIEAMEQAQASLKSAKELMERKRDDPRSERKLGPYDFGFWNEQNISFSGHSKHKTKKLQKLVHNQVERVVPSLLSEDAEEVVQGEESGSYKLPDQKERCHEWKIDKQFYELVSSEKLMRSRVINDEKCSSNEDIKIRHQLDAHQYYPEKETCGLKGQRFLQGGDNGEDENKLEMLNTFRINGKKTFSGIEFQMQDGNAKWLKSGIITDKEEAMNILETSARDDEDKEELVGAVQVPNDDIKKAVDPIKLIQQDRNENKLKQCQESGICAAENNNADSDSEFNSCERSSLGLMGFFMDGKSEEFDGSEALKEKLDQVKKAHLHTSSMDEISETSVVFEYDECRSDEVKVDTNNMEAAREESQLGMFKQMKNVYHASYNDGKDSEAGGIDNTYKPENMSFSGNGKTIESVKKRRAKWNIPNRSNLNVVKLFVQPVCSEKTDEALEFQKSEEKNVFEMPQKFENYEGRLTDYEDRLIANGEKRKDEKKFLGKVQAALELEAQQASQRIRVQNSKAVQQANQGGNKVDIPRPFVDASGSSWKQMENSTPDGWIDADNIRKDILDRERNKVDNQAELKRKLVEKERVREQEKDMTALENTTHEACERVFAEARESSEKNLLDMNAAEAQHRPITTYRDVIKSSAEAFEMSEKIACDAKLQAECAVAERAPAEARGCALSKQFSLGARRQAESSGNIPKDKDWKHNEAEDVVRHGNKDNEYNAKPTSDVHDAPVDMKIHSEGYEEESPLRCKARQERCRRIVERAAKALAEKNMRDLFAQREQAERNRLAESLDAEVRRWSSGKEGNLRALLSTLQYILGHDSGWQPIPLTDVITAAAVRKAYRKATLYVHPDKLQQRGATIQHKYICEKVFDLLKDAWSKFNSEGR